MTSKNNYNFMEDLKQQWLSMIDAIADPLVLIDNNYNIIRQNKAYFYMVENKEINNIIKVPGKKCYKIFAQRDSPCEHCLVQKINSQETQTKWTSEDLIQEKEFEIKAHYVPPKDNSNLSRFVVHYRDISEQKNLQKTLAHSDKLVAIGKLAGGVAHEINSPLAGILAFTQIVLSEMTEDNPHKEDLEQIEIAARKCKEIVENLLNFARLEAQIEVKNEIQILEEIQKTVKLAKGLLNQKNITIVWQIIDEENDTILGNAGQIGQIFLNLISNAIQAMKNGGVIEIEKYTENEHVCIKVKDTGSGIHPNIINKIFDPFFTTKTVGEGTGLGLSITYSLVKQHGGTISVDSILNEGTDFVLKFPLRKANEK
ncbi:sensor histidine kinase [Fluviispira multicolorata]|uniref:histidine kinase n=1 Tax=Fluviispira multicolorata TaxID=2654512 RepID=A0A833JC81_9BACT|nr:HAMP domain-containing sensor histidine kinase [Fluviispira multicolorata]KAB8030006.1 GHKL domain-containing protein [Fluviispira multicolorata]